MQWFYALFVSEKEVVNNLPMMPKRKLDEEKIKKLIKAVRKLLFFKKLKSLIKKRFKT